MPAARRRPSLLACAFLAICTGPLVPVAHSAESYDNCAGTITSLPVTISTQGVWCLKSDLATPIASGAAIDVTVNNVTIDCNDFKIGGLAAGAATQATGIQVVNRLNTTIRNCNVRGFWYGVFLWTGGGHVVEDNKFEGSTQFGIVAVSAGTSLRRNAVLDTGGSTFVADAATGMVLSQGVEAIDNVIAGVSATGNPALVRGISTDANGGGVLIGNRISGLDAGSSPPTGILLAASPHSLIEGNFLVHQGGLASAIVCNDNSSTSLRNAMTGFSSGVQGCVSTDDSVNPN